MAWAHGAPTPSARDEIALGQQLFNDTSLSQDGTVSCASCHNPAKAFTDGRAVAMGVGHHSGTRNTPTLETLALSGATSFFWDGRRASLEQTVLDPFTNPVEMGLVDQAQLIEKLRHSVRPADSDLRTLTPDDVAAALSAYVRSLDQRKSAFDVYQTTHDATALNARAQQGLILFSGKAHCADCHRLQGTPAMLTDHQFHRTGVGISDVEDKLPQLTAAIVQQSISGSMLGNQIATHADEAQLGRFNVTHDVNDIETFRTPSLRAVSLTAPYMHDGSVKTLDEAVDREVYYRGLAAGRPLNLSVEERKDLLAFLQSL